MTQPLLGIVASAIAIVVSLGFVALFSVPTFVGWVSFYMLAVVPAQIIVAVMWGANPSFAARLRQPTKGIALIVVTAVIAAVCTPIVWWVVGEGVSPPGPIPSQYAVVVVPTTFFLAIAFGGWPFNTLTTNRTVAGLLVLASAYAITFALFRAFFNYDFLKDAPVYLASAPQGSFNGTAALVFYVTMLAGMFLLLHFDLWPLTRQPALMKQPVLGVIWTALAFGAAVLAVVVAAGSRGLDPMYLLTRYTAPFIFGTIIVLNMLQNSLFARLRQPLKGLANAVTAFVIGVALAQLCGVLAPTIAGTRLAGGAPGYEYELWLVNALLSVTFPFLIVYAAYFGFWPLAPAPAPKRDLV